MRNSTVFFALSMLARVCFLTTASKTASFNTVRNIRSIAGMSKFDLPNRLKGNEKSVWVEYIQLALQYKPLNLGQGFPDYYAPENVTNALAATAKSDNPLLQQYTRGFGHPRLVNAIAKLYSKLINRDLNPNKEVLVTSGAYEALYATLQGHTNPGDEWIIIEPFFDCYVPMVQSAGGIPRYIALKPKSTSGTITSGDWVFDRKELESLFNNKTKGIIINTPHNPIGKVFTLDELQFIANLAKKWDTLVVSDEVYEHIVYEPYKHIRIATLPDMYERTITIGSAGKTFSVTGWKIGWAYGPENLLYNLQVVHQNSVYTCSTPIQEAVAIGFELEMERFDQSECYFNSLAKELLSKRDYMAKFLQEVGMMPTIPEGGYFMLANWSALENKVNLHEEKDENKDYRFTKWMTKNVGLQGIPPSAFYGPEHKHLAEDYVRYCFIKMETEVRTLKQELARTQDALKAATKKCRDLVKELDHRTIGHESEKILRDQQLSRILRALLYLEARLKQEQKSIRQMLCEKDNVIRNQQQEITMLRRYTKNYIKGKRDRTTIAADAGTVNANVEKNLQNLGDLQRETLQESGIGKDIASLKCEIITRLNPASSGILDELNRNSVKKTHSFAGSDISKASLTSSENTDASIITTTTEGSPSLLSTEGFCEGESTDVSPGSTLNKCSSRYTPTTVTDSENETTMIADENEENMIEEGGTTTTMTTTKRRTSLRRAKGQKTSSKDSDVIVEVVGIARTESKDDGLDCNFVSEDENQDVKMNSREENDEEPIYVNACNEANERHLQQTELLRSKDDHSNNNNVSEIKIETPELLVEDTSGNWYSDPDEDRLNDDVFRHNTYRPNSNHNSVLECVNQILLQDMEEEENLVLSVPRRFKHRGRIVRFQPARLSDIESVGSEMERRNSEESAADSKDSPREEEPVENETSASEDEFGMRIVQKESDDDSKDDSKAIPLVIIEPKIDVEETRKVLVKSQANNPPLKMERIEEKTCLQMSARGLTIARNLDYEDIESLPEVTMSPTPPRTPPALPPKPQFRNNTLILKKIPSPSFLIDEKRQQDPTGGVDPTKRGILGLVSSKAARNLNLEEAKSSARCSTREMKGREGGGFWKNRFNHVRSSFQVRQKERDQSKNAARVTNIVRHFEEFKIGDPEEQTKDRNRPKERHGELDQDFDIRQNFEEFNLDECDLSDDPDRPEGDGSERLGYNGLNNADQNGVAKDNNNIPANNGNGNSNGETSGTSGYDHFLEATGLSNKSILTPSRLLSNHKSMLKPKDVKYKSRIKATAVLERHGVQTTAGNTSTTHVRHWTGPFV